MKVYDMFLNTYFYCQTSFLLKGNINSMCMIPQVPYSSLMSVGIPVKVLWHLVYWMYLYTTVQKLIVGKVFFFEN